MFQTVEQIATSSTIDKRYLFAKSSSATESKPL